MTAYTIALLSLLTLSQDPMPIPPAARQAPTISMVQPADAWFAEDKVRHFLASFAATGYAYAGMRSVGAEPEVALPLGALAAAGLGIWKELADRAGGAAISTRDLVWDAAGIALGMVLIHQIR
jgi:uncharacterized protein YfiM (DUF2279 family)